MQLRLDGQEVGHPGLRVVSQTFDNNGINRKVLAGGSVQGE